MLTRNISASESFDGFIINGNIGDRVVVNALNLTNLNGTVGLNVVINCNGKNKKPVNFTGEIGKSSVINCGNEREVIFFGPVEDDVSIICKGQPIFMSDVGKGVKINGVLYQHQPSPPVAAEDARGLPDIHGPTFWNDARVHGGVYNQPITIAGSGSVGNVSHAVPPQWMFKDATELKKGIEETSSKSSTTVLNGSFFAQPVVCLGHNNIIGGQKYGHDVLKKPATKLTKVEEKSSKSPTDESDKASLPRAPGGPG